MGRALGCLAAAIWLFAPLQGPGTVEVRSAGTRLLVPVLIYHHVKELKPSDNVIERGLTVPPQQFQAELQYLKRSDFHTVTAAALVQALKTGRPLPSRSVVLTFDDGYVDMYPGAYRMLRLYHMTATFFVVANFTGTSPRYLSWSQIRDMEGHGMDIEAHSLTHPDLTTVGTPQQRREILQSRQVLERQLHTTVRLFAYPYGAYNRTIVQEVARAGYAAAFTTRQGWITGAEPLLMLPRVYVDRDDTLRIFAGRLRAESAILSSDPV